jgi:phage-related protein
MDEVFPIEAGSIAKHKRVLPTLDLHQPLFGSKRPIRAQVESYIIALVKLPEYIRQSRIVVDLFLSDCPNWSDTSCASSFKTPSIQSVSKASRKSKIKLRLNGDLVMIHVGGNTMAMTEFVSKVKDKLGQIHCSEKFVYKDDNGDDINVLDDEDLEIALQLYPTVLKLSHIDM